MEGGPRRVCYVVSNELVKVSRATSGSSIALRNHALTRGRPHHHSHPTTIDLFLCTHLSKLMVYLTLLLVQRVHGYKS